MWQALESYLHQDAAWFLACGNTKFKNYVDGLIRTMNVIETFHVPLKSYSREGD